MSEQDEPRRDPGEPAGEDDRDEDRAQILERRRRLIASALAGIALSAEGCERITSIAAPCLEPMAVDSGVRPNVCLAYMPPPEGVPQPCLAQRVVPQPCLMPVNPEPDVQPADATTAQRDSTPRTCLSISRPTPPRPRVCLSARMRPCLNVSSDESLFKEDDADEG